MNEMPEQQDELQPSSQPRGVRSRKKRCLAHLCVALAIIMATLAVFIGSLNHQAAQATGNADKLAPQASSTAEGETDRFGVDVICTVDGNKEYPLFAQFVCAHFSGVFADGSLMFGASYLDFIADMPVIVPKDSFQINIKPASPKPECKYFMRLYDQKNTIVYTDFTLTLDDLRDLPPDKYYLEIYVMLTLGDEYSVTDFFGLIDMTSGAVAGQVE